jgi:hypothetical protein
VSEPTPQELVSAYLARHDWRRSRSAAPRPPCRTISIWERWIVDEPERAWPVFEEFVRARPADDEVLEQVWKRMKLLLSRHGRAFEQRVRILVASNPRLTRIAPPEQLAAAAHRPRPFDPEALIAAYLRNMAATEAHDLWDLVRDEAALGVRLALEVVRRAPAFGFSTTDADGPLRDVLKHNGGEAIDAVESAAEESVAIRRALWRIAEVQAHPPGEWDLAPEIHERVEAAAAGTTDYNTEDPDAEFRSLLPEYERLLEAWFQYEESFWAWERLQDLVRMDPDPAWALINRLIEAVDDDEHLGSLGAGPLEDFVTYHGEHFIDRIEARAADNPRFRYALSCMWRTDISDALWARICAAAGIDPDEDDD